MRGLILMATAGEVDAQLAWPQAREHILAMSATVLHPPGDARMSSQRPLAAAVSQREAPVRHLRTKRVLLAAATAFLSIDLWTGAPLVSLWVGSRVVGQRELSMAAVGVVVVTLAVFVITMAFALSWLDGTYKIITGHPLRENRSTWLRSMNIENETVGEGIRTSALERIVMIQVYVATIIVIAYFFLVPVSPLPS